VAPEEPGASLPAQVVVPAAFAVVADVLMGPKDAMASIAPTAAVPTKRP
jgi:hypothetical protein